MSNLLRYEPNRRADLINLEGVRRLMTEQAEQGASIARQHTETPTAIRTEVVRAYDGRWAANIINTSPNARREEYGTRTVRATAPLLHVLQYFWQKDPNFWKSASRR